VRIKNTLYKWHTHMKNMFLLLLLLSYTSAEYTTSNTHCHGNTGENTLSPILDMGMCLEAAENMGVTYTETHQVETSQLSGGCFLDNSNLVFNEISSDKACNYDTQDYCLCRSLPSCDASNTDSCLCDLGSDYGLQGDFFNVNLICTPDTGLYCRSDGCVPGDDCLEQDGSTANIVDCVCGTTASNSQRGTYCYSTGNKVSSDPISVCEVRDGSVINSDACDCGILTCGEYEYCTESHSICTTTVVPLFCQIGEDGDSVKICATNVTEALDAAAEAAGTAAGTAAAADGAAAAALIVSLQTTLGQTQAAAAAAAALASAACADDAADAALAAADAAADAAVDGAAAAADAAAACADDAAAAADALAAADAACATAADGAATAAAATLATADAAAAAAADTLASAAEACPEVQLDQNGDYSVGPLDCDRIHSVYQNNQCCGTC
jgi:hypothetical protein